MSTILDALKRSEQERKLNKVPTLLDMPAPQERSRWPFVLVVVLSLILIAMLIWFFVVKRTPQVDTSKVVITNQTVNESLDANESVNSEAVIVNVISYSQEPNTRFAVINGKTFKEGEFVMAGVKIESILIDSVVLIERGQRITRKL